MKYLLIFIAVTMTVSCTQESLIETKPISFETESEESRLAVIEHMGSLKKSSEKVLFSCNDALGFFEGYWWDQQSGETGDIGSAQIILRANGTYDILVFNTSVSDGFEVDIHTGITGNCSNFGTPFKVLGQWTVESSWSYIPQGGTVADKIWGSVYYFPNSNPNDDARIHYDLRRKNSGNFKDLPVW